MATLELKIIPEAGFLEDRDLQSDKNNVVLHVIF